jgi:hypothetical protein
MRLQHELVLPQARIKKIKIELGAEEHKVTLEIQTALTQEVAEAFGCRELIYAGNVPRSGVESMKLEGAELNCDVHLKHGEFAFSTVVEEMSHYVAKLEGDGPKLIFHVKFTGYVITVADLIEHVKVDPLEVVLKPNQMDLELKDESAAESGVDEAQRLISPEQAADTAPAADGPSLAPAALMGGSHQKDNKEKRAGRQPIVDAEPAEEPDPFQEVVQ